MREKKRTAEHHFSIFYYYNKLIWENQVFPQVFFKKQEEAGENEKN